MTAPPFRTDPAVLEELRRGDERGFERFFRGSYPNLITVAKTELGEGSASASRVLEKVFVRVWAERESFKSPEELDNFVRGSVHDASVRERSRLGGVHRFEAAEKVHAGAAKGHPEATVDEAWTHVNSMIHAGANSSGVREQSRMNRTKDAAAHVKSMGKKGSWIIPVAVLATTAVVATAAISFLARGGEEVVLSNALAAADTKIISTSPGQSANMTLDDGTQLKVAPETRVRIPMKFGITVRGIRLDGAAQVKAAAGGTATTPFEMRLGKAAVQTTGATIDVASDSAAGTALVRLRDGAATIRVGKDIKPLAAGVAVAVDSSGVYSTPTEETLAGAFGWTDGKVTITTRPLKDAIKAMKKWWGLELYLKDAKLGERPVTLTADLDSPKAAISALEKSGNLVFGYEGKNMILTEGKAAAKTAAKKK